MSEGGQAKPAQTRVREVAAINRQGRGAVATVKGDRWQMGGGTIQIIRTGRELIWMPDQNSQQREVSVKGNGKVLEDGRQ